MGAWPAETVLVVESDSDVRALITRMLEVPGRRVLVAADAAEALEVATAYEIDLLLTDVLVPRVSGHRIAKLLRALQPGLPVIYVSGWFDHPQFPELDGEAVLQKPFSREQLTRAVADAIHGRAGSNSAAHCSRAG
jgi:two-component system cell cycle sensor histidine kinase/response regulator CckA